MLSIVAPVYNEESHVGEFIDRCIAAARASRVEGFELVLVDDGSRDRSREIIGAKMCETPGAITLVELSRNFGQQSAYHAGLSVAKGDVVLTLDSDLQDPPELIPELVRKLSEGYGVVYARRVSPKGGRWGASGHGGLKALGAYLFHKLISRTRDNPLPRDVGEYRCMRRRVVDRVLEFPENMLFLPGLVAYVGFEAGYVEYVRSRRDDRSPTSLRRLTSRALDALTTFSTAPIMLVLVIAGAAWLVPVGLGAVIASRAVWARELPSAQAVGWLVVAVGWCLTMSMLAIVAHYLGRVFIEVKRRPRYFVRRIVADGGERE